MRLSWIATSMLLGLALFAPAAQAQQRIAVVRVPEVVQNMAEGKKIMEAGQAREAAARQEGAKLEQDIQATQGQMGQLKAGSTQWNDLRDQLDKKKANYEVWAKITELTLGRSAKEDLKKLFDHVSDATQQVATEQHINLVIADAAPQITGPNLDQITVQQFQSALAQRIVLFADKTVDITQDVLTRVDAIYAKQNQAGPATPAPVVPGH
jgi:Skp family chaperone for outer membrane proteins